MKTYIHIFLLFTAVLLYSSCTNDWLEGKPDKSLIVPTKIEDYQYLLNNREIFGANAPGLTEISGDDVYLSAAIWQSLDVVTRNIYIWAEEPNEGLPTSDWTNAYQRIMQANIVLEGIEMIVSNAGNQKEWNSVKGQAMFYRALAYFDLSQLFCKPYDSSTAMSDLGLPLKINSDVNEKIKRSSLQETYDFILRELAEAKDLLPLTQQNKTMPTKHAVSGLLARIYLAMERYEDAFKEADECLKINGALMDYNSLDSTATYPMPLFNDEVVWHGDLTLYVAHPYLNGRMDTLLIKSYSADDLRKTHFYISTATGVQFRGSYSGTRLPVFCGIANDELYLIRAECSVRMGNIDTGLGDLNTLMKMRYRQNVDGSSTYQDLQTNEEDEALAAILKERRKELVLRNVRYSDLRRLNKDARFQKPLVRNMDGTIYTLLPNDPKYTFPIPLDEVQLGGLEQNPR